MGWLLSFITGGTLKTIIGAIADARRDAQNATTEQARIAAEERVKALEAKRDVVIAASANDRWWSTRELIGKCVFLYVFKIIVWDTVFQFDVTPNPGEQVTLIVMTVIGFYFVSRAAEKVADTISQGLAARRR